MKSISLYNEQGALCSQAQILISHRPEGISRTEWSKKLKEFKSLLSQEDVNEFERLRNNIYYAKYRKTNYGTFRDSNRKWIAKNPEKHKNIQKRTRIKNANKNKRYNLEWRKKNSKHVKNYTTSWRKTNKKHTIQYSQEYERKRRLEDPKYRFQHNIRAMCRRVVKDLVLGKKPTTTEKWIGCSPKEFVSYFESLFQEGMSWKNYGKWHVDHIRPVCSFLPDEWQQVNHYTNLRPLWAEDNLAKIVLDKAKSIHS